MECKVLYKCCAQAIYLIWAIPELRKNSNRGVEDWDFQGRILAIPEKIQTGHEGWGYQISRSRLLKKERGNFSNQLKKTWNFWQSKAAGLSKFFLFLSTAIFMKYYFAQDSVFKIQDSGFKIQKEKYENAFQKKYIPDFRKSKYESTIALYIIKLLFHTKICALQCRGFSQKFPKCSLLYFRYVWNQTIYTKYI